MKPITLAALVIVAGGTALAGILLWPVTGTSKAPAKQFATVQRKAAVRVHDLETHEAAAWRPVATAMAGGDLAAVRRAFTTYLASCPTSTPTLYNFRRPEVAKFYLAHGDRASAKAELDQVLSAMDYGRPDPLASDPNAMMLWLQAASDAPAPERTAVLQRWATAYRAVGFSRPDALPELGPEALLEFTLGQYDLGNHLRYNQAAEHFRRATILSPNSLVAAQGLADALRASGQKDEAKMAAIRASKLMDDPDNRFAYLASYGVTKEYLEKIKP